MAGLKKPMSSADLVHWQERVKAVACRIWYTGTLASFFLWMLTFTGE
jgi:hypothetical protein